MDFAQPNNCVILCTYKMFEAFYEDLSSPLPKPQKTTPV